MTGSRVALLAAIGANVLGWVLPAVYNTRGWEAFVLASSPLWAAENFREQPIHLLVLSVASALTNVLFIALAAMLMRREEWAKAVLWAAAAATLLNLHWPLSMGAERRLLASGYFMWACSFALLALAAFLAARPARR